jgi:hypothetical protein
MAKTTIGDVISRMRTQIKAVRQDAFLTDRAIYAFILKHAKWLMKREDGKNRLLAYSGVVQTMDFVELIEVDKVEACCTGISSDCKIKRTKEKMPIFMQGYNGPLIRSTTSIDGSESLQPTNPSSYLSMSKSKNFKFNMTKYYWYLNDYLYFPNLEWDAVRIEGIFEEDISVFTCAADSCIQKTDLPFNVPDYLFGEIESNTFKDLAGMLQLPTDSSPDKQSAFR